MILTCPNCAVRYQADEAKFPPAGRTVRCGKCRHAWHQPGFAAESEPKIIARSDTAPKAETEEGSPSALAWSARGAEASAHLPLGVSMKQQPNFFEFIYAAPAARWTVVIAIILVAALWANNSREDIAKISPHLPSLQSLLGHQMATQGIDLRNVGYQRENDDGQTMLVISGTITNNAVHELPVPRTIRVALSDENNNELFFTAFRPIVATLGAGKSVTFRTKIHDLPATNLRLEMHLDDQ